MPTTPDQAPSFLPDNIHLEIQNDSLSITRREGDTGWPVVAVFVAFHLISWGITLSAMFISLPEAFWIGLVLLVISSILLLLALADRYNRTVIRLEPSLLTITHRFWPYPFQLNSAEIKQFYSKERLSEFEDGTLHKYDLYLITQAGIHRRLLKGLSRSSQVLYLEQQLEQFLGLQDYQVPGSLGYASMTNSDFTAWRSLAEQLRLHFKWSLVPQVVGIHHTCDIYLRLSEFFWYPEQRVDTLLSITADLTAEGTAEPLPIPEVTELFTLKKPCVKDSRFEIKEDNHLQYKQTGIETDPVYLRLLLDTGCKVLRAAPGVVALGGEAIPTLLAVIEQKDHPLGPVATHLIQAIAAETAQRLQPSCSQLLCPQCQVRCAPHPVQVRSVKTTYYGCRACGQSRNFLTVTGCIIAVLDQRMSTGTARHEENWRVNWLKRRTLFDFEAVEIIQATDEEVERFVVQVSNDTDPVRDIRNRQIPCTVSPTCRLSVNTLRILRRTFKLVEPAN